MVGGELCGKVAAAGKAIYPLLMDANCALRDPLRPGPPGIEASTPGRYESGGPTDNVISIWKAAAPAIDIVGTDIYRGDPASYLKDLELYHRADNPLYVAETGGDNNSRFFFSALNLQTLGFNPFGAADGGKAEVEPWAVNYELVGPIQREIAQLNSTASCRRSPSHRMSTSSRAVTFPISIRRCSSTPGMRWSRTA